MLNFCPKNQYLLLPLFFLFFLFISSEVLSEEVFKNKSLPKCDVLLRVLKGSEKSEKLEGVKVKTGKYLEDVQLQLKSLPFRSYKVIGNEEQNIKLGSMGSFLVQDTKGQSHKLSVQPVSIGGMSKTGPAQSQEESLSSNHATVKLDWFGPNKESLLSSKLHIKNGQDIIIGTDASKELSTIFCVKVDCSES